MTIRRRHMFQDRRIMRRVVVTGLGVCCPLGVGVRHVWKRLLEGHSGIVSLSNRPGFEQIPSRVVGLVPRGEGKGEFNETDWVTPSQRKMMSLNSVFALCASTEALKDASWEPISEDDRIKTGVTIGSCIAELEEVYQAGFLLKNGQYRRLSPYFIPRILTNMSAGHVSMRFNLQGPNHSVSTACTTGLHAIGDAACMIARGACDVMVAGGTEACIHPIAFAGFCRAKALSTKFNSEPHKASRPFDSDRDGFVLGEGAGIMILEELDHAQRRNAQIYAEILGYGMSGDAYHVTAPSEDGRGSQLCMRSALKDAGLAPESVGHINVHATSTPLGDSVENGAIKELFGSHSHNLLISAPKSSIGHLLGAAGSVEAIFAILAIKEGIVPPTLNLMNLTPEFDLNYVPHKPTKWESYPHRRIALKNSFGFGGTNASLCIGEMCL